MEIAGIPTVNMIYADQITFLKNVALINGCPNIRFIVVPRLGEPDEMIASFYDKIAKALTDPLTAKEKESGLYSPPAPPRVLFEGTMTEAQDFLQQTVLVENCRNCPIAKYTDGLPVIIPTEEAVAAMLTGTKHSPTETIALPYATSATGKPGAVVSYAQKYTATVEKVAITAVMAGCKPQYLPVALAIATSGGGGTDCPGSSGSYITTFVVSGPIAKEIGMNAGQQALDVGNPANMTLGRVGALMTVNFGGCITGLVRTTSGHPIHSVCFAEDLEGLPPGWVGYNEESTYYKDGKLVNYTKNERVLGKFGGKNLITSLRSQAGYYRNLNSGLGDIARGMGIPEGQAGHYNWLEFIAPTIVQMTENASAKTFILHMNLAELLYEAGFKTKADVYQWLWNTYFITVDQLYHTGEWSFMTNGGLNIEPTSGKSYKDLVATAPDYKLHAFGGPSATSNCIIVADSFADEHWYLSTSARPTSYPIDPWR